MVVKDVSRAEFNRLLPLHSGLEHLIGKEVEWFSDKRGNILGTIALGGSSRGWNYVILKRNRIGKFHVCDVACDFYNHASARVSFMVATVAAGQNRWVQFPSAHGE